MASASALRLGLPSSTVAICDEEVVMPVPFKGQINVDIRDSEPDWTPFEPPRAPDGAPNVLYVVLDDVGFSAMSCYGGPIETPNVDRIAANGVRFTQWHTTALCSPTRSCLLNGRNHTRNSMACITEAAIGFPNASGTIPPENGMLSEILGEVGWNTYMVGKWHLCPTDEMNLAATRRNWPSGRGFERWYGFLGAETNQWYPDLVYDNHPVEPPRTPEEGYHLTDDLTDKAIEFIKDTKTIAPEKPFFLYYAPGACHAPHHAPKEWIEKFEGRFDMGYEAMREQTLARQKELGLVPADVGLPPLNPIGTPDTRSGPDNLPFPELDYTRPWDSLNEDERRLFSRMAEVYAGFLAHADHHLGRLLDYLEQNDQLENTLVVVVSDNGASGEGGPNGSVNEMKFANGVPDDLQENLAKLEELGGTTTYNHYPNGWAMAFNTPFKMWKRYEFNGGTADPCIISWPAGTTVRGEIRDQYHHAIDIVPTILDVLGVEAPETIKGHTQTPFDGVSMRDSLDDASASSARRTQFYSMLGSRSIWHEGWKAVTTHRRSRVGATSTTTSGSCTTPMSIGPSSTTWPTSNRTRCASWSTSGSRRRARMGPSRLDDRSGVEILTTPRPQLTAPRSRYVYYPDTAAVSEWQAVNTRNRSFVIGALVDIPAPGSQGVLFALGARFGGHALYVKNNRLQYVNSFVGAVEQKIVSTEDIPTGENLILSAAFEKDGMEADGAVGTLTLYHGDRKVGEGRIKTQLGAFAIAGAGLYVGRHGGEPVTDDYPGEPPYLFTGGTINRVAVDVSGEPYMDLEREATLMLMRE
jgi:arylsulfatase A-like enzyme